MGYESVLGCSGRVLGVISRRNASRINGLGDGGWLICFVRKIYRDLGTLGRLTLNPENSLRCFLFADDDDDDDDYIYIKLN